MKFNNLFRCPSFTSTAKIAHAGIKRQGYTSGREIVRFSAAPPGLDILPGYALLVAYMVIKGRSFFSSKDEQYGG